MKIKIISKNIIGYWLPPVFWMILIFLFSSRHTVSITNNFLYDFVFFKSLHLFEYAVLYLLLFRAFYSSTKFKLSQKFAFSFIILIIYSLSDEFHQTYIISRQGTIRDVFINIGGAFLMYIYIKFHLKKVVKFFSGKNI